MKIINKEKSNSLTNKELNYCLDYLSLENTNCAKGLLSLCILMHHVARSLSNCKSLSPFQHIGGMVVAIFFFYSGYGLMIQCLNKPDYEKNFLSKRTFSILIPYAIVTPLYMWIHNASFIEMIQGLYNGFPVVSNSWFVIHIFLFYIVFWILMVLCNKKTVFMISGATLVITCWVWITFKNTESSYWYNCSHLLIIGMLWAVFGEKIINKIRNHYFVSLSCFTALFLLNYFISRQKNGFELYCYRNIMYVLSTMIFLTIIQKISFKNQLISYMGKISFEIYLTHGFVILYLEKLKIKLNNIIFVILVLVLSIIISSGLHIIVNSIKLGTRTNN